MPDGASAGEVLCSLNLSALRLRLTHTNGWSNPDRWSKVSKVTTVEEVKAAYRAAELNIWRD